MLLSLIFCCSLVGIQRLPALVSLWQGKDGHCSCRLLVLTGNLISEGERLTFFQCLYQSPKGHDCPSLNWWCAEEYNIVNRESGYCALCWPGAAITTFQGSGEMFPRGPQLNGEFWGHFSFINSYWPFQAFYYLSQL